jgi:hypothetical protein
MGRWGGDGPFHFGRGRPRRSETPEVKTGHEAAKGSNAKDDLVIERKNNSVQQLTRAQRTQANNQ